jgi:hypothetical protein
VATGAPPLRGPDALGLRPLPEPTWSAGLAGPGRRLETIRAAAGDLRRHLRAGGFVVGVRTVDVVTVPYPARLAIGGLPATVGTWVTLIARMLIVQFDDFSGTRRTLVWEPMRADSLAQLPFYGRVFPPSRVEIPRRRMPSTLCSVERALARCGLEPADVDFVSCGDLRGYDLRSLLGSRRPPAVEHAPRAPLLGGAHLLVRRAELGAARSPHPVMAPWYVTGGAHELLEDRLVVLDADVELGPGVALISTPGLTPGHQSLVLNLRQGIWVVSSNGVASDCWQPLLSKLPGVRRGAERDGREVVLAAEAAESAADLYDAMVLERSLADASRADPRWLAILPSAELAARRRQWPMLPTFSHGALDHGPSFTSRS